MNSFKFILLSLTFLYFIISFTELNKHCWNDIDFLKTEKKLKTLSVIDTKNLFEYFPNKKTEIIERYKKSGSSIPIILTLKDNTKAIFKPNRPLLDQASALRAYYFSQALNLKLVPPTVIRTIDKKRGVVQLFIENTLQTDNKKKVLDQLPNQLKNSIYIFYTLIGELNISISQILFDKNCSYPILIDNEKNLSALSVIEHGDFPYIKIHKKKLDKLTYSDYKSFPFDNKKSIINFSKANLKKIFNKEYKMIEKMSKNLSAFNQRTLHYISWKKTTWVKYNLIKYNYLYKDLAPQSLSKNILKKLKQLNYTDLNSIPYENFFNIEEQKSISEIIDSFDKFLIYKRNELLNHFEK